MASDRFRPLSMEQLTAWVFDELETNGSIFGIPRDHFFAPSSKDRFRLELYGQTLETPLGVAAGPHTQMAQNIIAAWLCGARFIELKTVQTLDELDISKPCIDMQDEGYNVEWSQELKVDQSFEEYLRAWVLIHALHRKLGFPGERPGLIFNMSVGYDLAGIKKANVQEFLGLMGDAGERLGAAVDVAAQRVPALRSMAVPRRLSDNVTVSTMHGCPPDEIGKICQYLMKEWHLHTNVKLNPTLLGADAVRSIVNDALGYRSVVVPDEAFGHDLKYPDAVELVKELLAESGELGVRFGVKLCNTLEVVNERDVFDRDANGMMYMSGRPHHVVAVNVAAKLARELASTGEPLLFSFAGGADAWNVVDLLTAGMTTVTTCSDILKPGGYGRLTQYLEQVDAALDDANAGDLDELILARAMAAQSPEGDVRAAALANLERYARSAIDDDRYKKASYERRHTKTSRPLGSFDCIEAPCTTTCPVSQQVPRYISCIRAGDPEAAAAVIRADNVMGAVLGRACTHACELTCIRSHYDQPVAIRELKRFAMDHEAKSMPRSSERTARAAPRIAVIGGGPCGLSAAYFLGRAGYDVSIFERLPLSGGMVSSAIPAYRVDQEVLDQDLAYLSSRGVTVQHGRRVRGEGGRIPFAKLRGELGFDIVVLATGAPRGLPLRIPGEEGGAGVFDGLAFLQATRRGTPPEIAPGPVGVIGGGDVAMDCARTAARLAPGRVSVIYRRTMEQMPAHHEELEGLLEEGIEVRTLLSPVRVIRGDDGAVKALECQPMVLGEPDDSGRRRPIPSDEAPVEVPLGTLIVAIGQQPDLSLLGGLELGLTRWGYLAVDPETLETSVPGIYAGGDVVDEGPATIVKALGDGKRIATAIRRRHGDDPSSLSHEGEEADGVTFSDLMRRRSRRVERVAIPAKPPAERSGFEEIVGTLSAEVAHAEAERCLRCDLLCNLCVTVCPNRAFSSYRVAALTASLPELELVGGKLEQRGSRPFTVSQGHQVAVLNELCNECGNCATFCPTAGRPYHDKPRVFADQAAFEAETDNAFMISGGSHAWTIRARVAGATHVLTRGETLRYASPTLLATIDPAGFTVVDVKPGDDCPTGRSLSLETCATMFVLADGVTTSLPHWPLSVD